MIYSINEGQQAEEYKARKTKEIEENRARNTSRSETESLQDGIEKSFVIGNKARMVDDNGHFKFDKSDVRRRETSMNRVVDEVKRRNNRALRNFNYTNNKNADNLNTDKYFGVAVDAVNRHMRRHPEQYKESCGIFTSIDFI